MCGKPTPERLAAPLCLAARRCERGARQELLRRKGTRSAIEARGLTKKYRDRLAVDDLTFTVRPGIVTGFRAQRRQVDHHADDPRAGRADLD
jgi:hypothetical protein